MYLDRLDRNTRRIEVKKLEALKEDFMRDYGELCKKYNAHLSPVLGMVGDNMIRLGMSLDAVPPVIIPTIDALTGEALKGEDTEILKAVEEDIKSKSEIKT